MPYIEHKVNGDKEIIETGSHLLMPKLNVLDKFTRFAPERFFGQAGDTVTVRVPGALPAREYGWRNDRAEPIKTDVYEETVVTLTVNPPTNDYSAVKLTDEQKEFDLGGSFGVLTDAQTTAVADKVNHRARQEILNAPYEVALAYDVSRAQVLAAKEIGQDVWFNAFVDADRELTRLGVPFTGRTAIVGSAVASELKKSNKMALAQTTADTAFARANIGVYAGFNIVEDLTNLVDTDEALLFDRSGFLFWSYAPSIPEGASRGARSNKDGVAMRWLVDYDHGYQVDRSTWNSWTAFNYARDLVQGYDSEGLRAWGEEFYFVRGVKLIFSDGTGGWKPGDNKTATNGRKGASATSELARYYNGQPIKTGTPQTGQWYPSVLEGTVGIQGFDVDEHTHDEATGAVVDPDAE